MKERVKTWHAGTPVCGGQDMGWWKCHTSRRSKNKEHCVAHNSWYNLWYEYIVICKVIPGLYTCIIYYHLYTDFRIETLKGVQLALELVRFVDRCVLERRTLTLYQLLTLLVWYATTPEESHHQGSIMEEITRTEAPVMERARRSSQLLDKRTPSRG